MRFPLPLDDDLEERVGARTAQRFRKLARALGARGDARHAALAADVARGVQRAHPAEGLAGELRAWLSQCEQALRLETLVAAARRATTGRARSTRQAALFAELAETPYLLAVAPKQRVDAAFNDRAARLSADLTAEALAELPLAVATTARDGLPGVRLPVALDVSAERAVPRGRRPLGLSGCVLATTGPAEVELSGDELIVYRRGRVALRVDRQAPHRVHGRGASVDPRPRVAASPSLRLGHGLRLAGDALRVGDTPGGAGHRLGEALALHARVWPAAWRQIHRFTEVVVPLEERGTVSYSLPARPGYVYINVNRKSLLERTDDLLHETAHHHLHAIEELAALTADDGAPVWWSPWRRAWRPLRGLVHATFTFTWGAALFAHLVEADDRALTPQRRRRAGRRLRDEVAMCTAAHDDLERAEQQGLLTPSGREVCKALRAALPELNRAARGGG